MTRSSRRSRKRLSDSEVLERLYQRFHQGHYLPPAEERKRFWKFAFVGSFVVGPFVMILPFMAWFELVPFWYLLAVFGLNASFLFFLAFFFDISHRMLGASLSIHQERKNSFVATWYFVGLGWEGLFTSLMLLLATAGALVRLPGGRWWVYPLLAYGVIGIGLWAGRKEIVRAVVEGPEAHPWFWPVRIFFSLSLGTCVLGGSILRILINVMEQRNVGLTTVLVAGLFFSLIPLFLGLALLAWILAYLHYQKWRGVEELRL